MSARQQTRHGAEHEAQLVAALADDGAVREGAYSSRIPDCPECRARFAKLIAVRELLDDAGREERETLAELDWKSSVPGSDVVAPFVRGLAEQRRNRLRADRQRRWIVWVASAAASLLVIGWIARLVLRQDVSSAPNDITLGPTQQVRMSPQGPVREYSPFEWALELPSQGHFELRIWDDRAGAAADPFAKRTDLDQPRCPFSPEQTRTWPDKIRWQVLAYDATGAQLPGVFSASAERSPH